MEISQNMEYKQRNDFFFTYLTNQWGVILIRLQHSAIEVQNSTGQSGNQIIYDNHQNNVLVNIGVILCFRYMQIEW